MRKFTPVTIQDFSELLVPRKFYASRRGYEATFVGRLAIAPHVAVVVYTACTVGSIAQRASGADAVRVVVSAYAGNDGEKQNTAVIHTGKRILRTGGKSAILSRVNLRVQECLAWAKTQLRQEPCENCGAAVYRSGMCVNRACREENSSVK